MIINSNRRDEEIETIFLFWSPSSIIHEQFIHSFNIPQEIIIFARVS